MADAERGKIIDDGQRVAEGEVPVKLEPIGRARWIGYGGRARFSHGRPSAARSPNARRTQAEHDRVRRQHRAGSVGTRWRREKYRTLRNGAGQLRRLIMVVRSQTEDRAVA